MAQTQQRGYTASRFGLELAGVAVGSVQSVEGGQARGKVVAGTPGADGVVPKHIGSVDYDDIVVQAGANMERDFYDWLATAFTVGAKRKDGAISLQDYSGRELQRLTWSKALIKSVELPTFDTASKDLVTFTVTIAPTSTANVKGTPAPGKAGVKAQNLCLASNFRLTVDGVNCSRVRKIEGLRVALKAGDAGGREREAEPPSALEVSDFVVSVAEEHAEDFIAWHKDLVVDGHSTRKNVRDGKLELLAKNMHDVLFTIELHGVGIFGFVPTREVSGSAAIATVQAQLFCEQIVFEHPAAPPAPPPPNGAVATLDPTATLVTALQSLLGRPLVETATPKAVAARLLATTTNSLIRGGDDDSANAERGRQIGAAWARDRASLDELQQVSATRGGDWTNLVVPADNSLVGDLQTAGVVPPGHEGPVTLDRDTLIEGIVEGAAGALDEVRPHLAAPAEPV